MVSVRDRVLTINVPTKPSKRVSARVCLCVGGWVRVCVISSVSTDLLHLLSYICLQLWFCADFHGNLPLFFLYIQINKNKQIFKICVTGNVCKNIKREILYKITVYMCVGGIY